jgi:glyoxylase-like metal-dependent hydrolase (beta-lactamase superfamily II)
MMIIETFPVGVLQCNCTVLGCEETRRALVIDPGDDPQLILNTLQRLDLTCEALLHTHAHLDHVSATERIAAATGARVLLHQADQVLYDMVELQARVFGFPVPSTIPVDHHVIDGEEMRVGGIRGEILHTPGHTPGSLCLRLPEAGPERVEPRLFAGDTIFLGSIGRTDLWGGDMTAILRSIQQRLLTLPDETVVVPGHGPLTTIGHERRTNPFLQ